MNPFNQGLMSMAGAMLTPGGGLGQGFQAFGQGLAQGQQMQAMQTKQGLLQQQMQMAQAERQQKAAAARDTALQRQQLMQMMGLGGASGAQGTATAAGAPAGQPGGMPDLGNADVRQRLAMLMLASGMKKPEVEAALTSRQMGVPDPIKVGSGDVLVDPSSYKEVFRNEKPVDWNQLIVQGPDGKPMVNQMLLDAQLQKARAGATQTSLTVNAGKDLAGQVGDLMKAERTGVEGAMQLAGSADQLEQALDSGRVIAGPGATARVSLLQLGRTLGVSGKTTDEILTNTRQAIRSLAQMDVQARKQLQGQGQVTENEAKAVAKAEGGNIDEMTVPELRLLVGLTRKVTAYKAQQYRQRLQSVPAELRPFYDLPGLDRYGSQAATEPRLQAGGQVRMPSQADIDAELRRRGL